MGVLVGPGRDESLLARVDSQGWHVMTDYANLGQLQLRLAVVTLEDLLALAGETLVVQRLDLGASDR